MRPRSVNFNCQKPMLTIRTYIWLTISEFDDCTFFNKK